MAAAAVATTVSGEAAAAAGVARAVKRVAEAPKQVRARVRTQRSEALLTPPAPGRLAQPRPPLADHHCANGPMSLASAPTACSVCGARELHRRVQTRVEMTRSPAKAPLAARPPPRRHPGNAFRLLAVLLRPLPRSAKVLASWCAARSGARSLRLM